MFYEPARDLSWWLFHVRLNRMCLCCVGWPVLSMPIRPNWLMELFNSTIYLLIFCWPDLPFTDGGMKKFSKVFVCLKKALFSLHFWKIISLPGILGCLFFQRCKHFVPLSFCLPGEMFDIITVHVLLKVKCAYFLTYFKIFSLFFISHKIYLVETLRCWFCLVLPEVPESVVWCLLLALENSQPFLFQIFILFLSFFSFDIPITCTS